MVYKTIIISIFVAVSFISSVENAEEITCGCDNDFLEKANASKNQIVGIVVTNIKSGFPPYMKLYFGNVVTKFLIIEIEGGRRNFTQISKFLNPWLKPTLYIMQYGYILKTSVNVTNIKDNINELIDAARNLYAEKMSETPITDGFEAFDKGKPAGKQAKARKKAGSTSGSTKESSNSGQKRGIGFSLNDHPPTEDDSYRGAALRINDNDNNYNRRMQTSGDDNTPSANSVWLFGKQINDRNREKQPRSPSLPPQKKSKKK